MDYKGQEESSRDLDTDAMGHHALQGGTPANVPTMVEPQPRISDFNPLTRAPYKGFYKASHNRHDLSTSEFLGLVHLILTTESDTSAPFASSKIPLVTL